MVLLHPLEKRLQLQVAVKKPKSRNSVVLEMLLLVRSNSISAIKTILLEFIKAPYITINDKKR